MIKIALRVFWTNSPMPVLQKVKKPDVILDVPFGNVLILNTGTLNAPVHSVNSKIGHVVLNAQDVGADQLGSANTVKEQLLQNILQIKTLAETNQLKLTQKVDVQDFELLQEQSELNRLALLSKADIQALAHLALLVDTKADQSYVQQQIANLVGSAPEALDTIYELATALQNNSGLIEGLNQSVANRVRFDIATQALTEIQKQNARTNIGAEELGTAQQLINQITAQSLGAATASQGAKAETALQSADVAPVALTGLFSSLDSQNKIFDVVHNAYVEGANIAISASDTLGQMLGKLQAQIKANSGSKPINWIDLKKIATFNTKVYLPNTTLQIANIGGDLWVKGAIQITSQISSNDPIFTINSKDWFVIATIGGTSQVGLMSTFDLYGNTLAIFNFGFIQATAISAMRFYCLSNTPSNPVFNFMPFNIGTLLNPSVGLSL